MLVVPSVCSPGYDDIYSTAAAPLINNFLAGLASFAKFQDSRNFQGPQFDFFD
jgi:hypothetical protein